VTQRVAESTNATAPRELCTNPVVAVLSKRYEHKLVVVEFPVLFWIVVNYYTGVRGC
jgi:hypothetical protein